MILIPILVAIAMVVTPAIQSAKAADKYVRERVLLLHSETGSCTGVIVEAPSGREVVLTAGHCVDLATEGIMRAQTEKGEEIMLTFLGEAMDSDLAVFSYPKDDIQGLEIGEAPKVHQPVHTLTHGEGRPTYRTDGEILNTQPVTILMDELMTEQQFDDCERKAPKYRPEMTLFGPYCVATLELTASTAQVRPGSSGGPLLDDAGNLVGIVSAGDEHFGMFVKHSDIIKMLANY